MAIRLAILGLDPIQRNWLEAAAELSATGEIEVVAVAHRTLAGAKETAAQLKLPKPAPPFDDLRLLLKEAAPQVILLDRPSHLTIDFLLACVAAEIAIFSLGPPVETLAEAQALAAALTPQTHLLYIWPRFIDAPASRRCAQADDFVRPIRFADAAWMGVNHALAKTLAAENPDAPLPDLPVRSLSVLAWDALATLIRLMELPTSVYAAIRGTMGSGSAFSDLSGAASLTLRFPEDAAASLTLCDRAPSAPTVASASWNRRELFLWGAGGTLQLHSNAYEFRDAEGRLIDSGPPADEAAHGNVTPVEMLREFLRHRTLPPSPQRGWHHQLEEVAATMEALVVSHRTGQAESPEKFMRLRR